MPSIESSVDIPGLVVVTPEIFEDHRGQYVETWNARDWDLRDEHGEPLRFVEDDLSCSEAGVLRGLHGDDRTWKLIQCVSGRIRFVVVDMRRSSPAFRRWRAFELDDRDRRQVLVPAGCANGHYAHTDCIFGYKQSAYYRGQGAQFTVRWNDPSLAITWPTDAPVLSARDAAAPDLPADGGGVP
ncbi:MAG: dTDP-4-dehydrorhamnose 3,5-epimerase [Acidobacteriota bacterium]